MKLKLITISFLTIMSINVFAQMYISTNLRQVAIWDNEKEEWLVYSTDEEELTFFEFNNELTMFKHTTVSLTSAYLIKSNEYDEESEIFEFDVVSDVGNKYLMILDLMNENVRFIFERDGRLFAVQHSIKKIWFDEEDGLNKNLL